MGAVVIVGLVIGGVVLVLTRDGGEDVTAQPTEPGAPPPVAPAPQPAPGAPGGDNGGTERPGLPDDPTVGGSDPGTEPGSGEPAAPGGGDPPPEPPPPPPEPSVDPDVVAQAVFDTLASCAFFADVTSMQVEPVGDGTWSVTGDGMYPSGEPVRFEHRYDPATGEVEGTVYDDDPEAFESVMPCP